MAVEAYVLMRVQGDRVAEALGRLVALPSVKAAHAVTGPYDLIAQVSADDMSTLSRTVLSEIRPVPGVAKTVTCLVIEVA